MKIAILSRRSNLYSTRRLVESAKKRGHEVIVLDHLKCVLLIKNNLPEVFYNGEKIENVDAIVPRIGASVTYYGAAVVRHFEQMQVFSAVGSSALVRSRDKLSSLQSLAREGIGIPQTAITSTPSNIDVMLKQVGGTPVVIKLLEGTHGIGVILAETIKSAKSVIESFMSLKANMLVQEYIKEAEGADLRAFVVDGRVVAAMKRQGAKGEFRSNLHQGGTSEMIELTPKEEETAIKAVKRLGLGVAGVDMLQSDRGPLVMEVNASPGLQGIENITGIDIADKIIAFLELNEFNYGV